MCCRLNRQHHCDNTKDRICARDARSPSGWTRPPPAAYWMAGIKLPFVRQG